MKKQNWLLFAFGLFILWGLGLAADKKNTCLECHLQLEDKLALPARSFPQDIHANYGLLCSDCHGGNAEKEDIEEAKDKTFRGTPSRQNIPKLCASCHSNATYMRNFNPRLRVDQLELYLTSKHGQAFEKGDLKPAICTDCHGVHGIQAANMPQSKTFAWNIAQTCGRCHSDTSLMKSYNLPANQEEDYRTSVHAQALYEKKDLSAPTCNDCHGNHGASPPEVTSVANVCRQCHPSPSQLFVRSAHKAVFDEAGISECEACHGHHRIVKPTDEMLPGGKLDTCVQCHEANSQAFQQGAPLRQELQRLATELESLDSRLDAVAKKGVEVSEARFQLQEARTPFFEARNLVHGLSFSEMESRLKDSSDRLSRVRAMAEAAEKESQFRKTGLIIATAFLFLLALGILLKARQLRQRRLKTYL